MKISSIKTFARDLLAAHDQGGVTTPPSSRDADFNWDTAYEVLADIVAARRARGERCIGRKIGFTNRNIWTQYGATSPIWAPVYDSTLSFAQGNRAALSLRGSVAPRLEPEIAFKLRSTVPTGCRDPAVIMQSIEWLAPSFEIVDCRYADWKFKSPDSAADQSLHWRLIVGEPYAVNHADVTRLTMRIRDCTVDLSCGGEIRDRGVGSNALDHPALALAFLADILATQPQFDALAAGEIVTTGTLTAALPVAPGETWTSTIAGLPVKPLSVTFSV